MADTQGMPEHREKLVGTERGTHWFFGRPYHYERNVNNRLTLLPGKAPEGQPDSTDGP